ncbi:MAG: hypothetical protein JWQ46_705 [Phenylobacterium sp.]|nr:hypothetical protein [Phenylobacterium sp.]
MGKGGFAELCAKGDAPGMAANDSALDLNEMARARALLAPAPAKERMWPVLGAAALAAVSALAFATAMIMAPPVVSEHVVAGKTVR